MPNLLDLADQFAISITQRLQSVVGTNESFSALVTGEGQKARVAVGVIDPVTLDFGSIPMTINGEERLRLFIKFHCDWDSSQDFLAIDASFFHVRLDDKDTPLFRYEYIRRATRMIPCAHLQLHAHRDEMIYLMMASDKGRPKARQRKQSIPRLAEFHFPVGGHRFRPCMEDVLQALILEFGIDAQPGWRAVIEEGRRDWRHLQLAAAVRDCPEVAAEVLDTLGYKITPPESALPENHARLSAF